MNREATFSYASLSRLGGATLVGLALAAGAQAQTPVTQKLPLPTDSMNGVIIFATLVGPNDGYAVEVSVHAEFTPSGGFTPDDLQVVIGSPTDPNFPHWVLQGGPDFGWGTGSGLHVGDSSTLALNGEILGSPFGFSLWNLTIEPVLGSGHNGVSGKFSSNSYVEVKYLPVGSGPAVGYCFGNACPCGNDDPGAGCANSTGSGALLAATGLASAALDDLDLTMTGMPASHVGLVYAGQAQVSMPFGDGLRCVGAGPLGLVRLPSGLSDGSGTMTTNAVISTAQGTVAGALAPGSTWNLQGWYRDPAGTCTTGFNLSNGLSVVIIP